MEWKGECGRLPRLFAGLIQTYRHKTATALKAKAHVAYSVQVVLSSTKRKKSYTSSIGHALLGILPVKADELREGDGEQDLDKRISMRGFAWSEVISLEDAVAQT